MKTRIALIICMVGAPVWAQEDTLAPLPSAAPATQPASQPPGVQAPVVQAPQASVSPDVEAPTPLPAQAPDVTVPSGSLQRFFRLSGGLRVDWPSSSGVHSFNRLEGMPGFTLDGSQTVLVAGRFSLAVGGQLDISGSSDELRQIKTDLGVRKLSVTAEARYHLHPRWYAHGKIAPGVAWASAGVQDVSSASKRTDDAALFAAEATLGVSLLVTEKAHVDKRPFRLWLSGEGGYVVSSSHRWALTSGDDVDRQQPTNLGSFSLTTPMMRLAIAGSY